MDNLIFSQTAIFRMQQLASSFYHKTGIRHRMASPEGMLALLREAALSTDKHISDCYDYFVVSLTKQQVEMLRQRNVKLRSAQSLAFPLRKAG
jgi:hypothetical protein